MEPEEKNIEQKEEETEAVTQSKVMLCNCKNEFQDEEYGKQMRVWNRTNKNDKRIFRCTVCSKER